MWYSASQFEVWQVQRSGNNISFEAVMATRCGTLCVLFYVRKPALLLVMFRSFCQCEGHLSVHFTFERILLLTFMETETLRIRSFIKCCPWELLDWTLNQFCRQAVRLHGYFLLTWTTVISHSSKPAHTMDHIYCLKNRFMVYCAVLCEKVFLMFYPNVKWL